MTADKATEAGPAMSPGGPAAAASAADRAAVAGRGRLVVLIGAVVGVILLAVVAANALGGPGRQVETGIVVAVQATSLSSVQGFSIRTEDGRTIDFRVGTLENAAKFPPGHLAGHKATLVPIRVTYIEQGGSRVAVQLEDAR